MKTNKSVRSRVKVTKKGIIKVRGVGHGHLNSKHSRSKQLNRNRGGSIKIGKKAKQRFIDVIK